jgi:hypothetical protein
MPLLIRALGYEEFAVTPELTPLCPQSIAQRCLLITEMFRSPIGKHTQTIESSA